MSHSNGTTGTHLKRLILLIAFFMFLAGCQPTVSSSGFTTEVKQILSGREFEVAGVAPTSDITERIRLEGIDVPDIGQQPWGEAAKTQLEKRLRNQTVRIETDAEPRDAIGRRLAYVWQGNVLLNEALVAEGLALVTPHTPNSKYDQRLAHAQEYARVLGLGIWNPDQPLRVSPAEFRRQRRGVGSKKEERREKE